MLLRSLVGNYARQAATTGLREFAEKKIEHDREQIIQRQSESIAAAVLFATTTEAGGLCDLLKDLLTVKSAGYVERSGHAYGRTFLIVETGVGAESSRTAIQSILQPQRIPLVVVAGFAASLEEHLLPGHILVVDKALNEAGDEIAFYESISPESIEAKPNWHHGDLVSVSGEIRTAAARRELAETTPAIACDMETFAIAAVCKDLKVPCVAVRVIADGMDDEDQEIVGRISSQDSLAAKLGATAGAIWKKPKIATRMLGLKQTAIQRSDELAAFVDGLLRQVPK